MTVIPLMPRIFTNNMTSYRYEKGMPDKTLGQLKRMGHKFGDSPAIIGNVQSILIDHKEGTFKGVADSSRNGAAIGISF